MILERPVFGEFTEFLQQFWQYISKHGQGAFFRFERGKDVFTGALYTKRGKYARPFLHSAMMALIFFGFTLGPKFVQQSIQAEEEQVRQEAVPQGGEILGETTDQTGLVTLESDKTWNEVSDYEVKDGDTLSSIAAKFDVSVDSVKWANESVDFKKLKPGLKLTIPPVTGIIYKVKPGDTIYSIAKKFDTDPQGIVDFPLNTFTDDETFALAAGQSLIVPDGVMPDAPAPTQPRYAKILTPDAGSVTASGAFVWPAFGRITQPFRSYHRALDIANNPGTPILAADAGKVVVAGWSSVGYGNHVIIDHQNGYMTLYAHMSNFSVVVGQKVARGSQLGAMGSTGRSTGPHLHFEIRVGGGNRDPLGFLK